MAALTTLKQSLASNDSSNIQSLGQEPGFVVAKPDKPIKELPDFAAVISGNIFVNGQSIDINFSTDSLADIISRIDSLDGVEAQVSPRLVINNSDSGSKLDLIDNGTGFLAAVYLAGGSSRPNDLPETSEEKRRSAEQKSMLSSGNVEELKRKINFVFNQQPQILEVEKPLEAVKNNLLSIVNVEIPSGKNVNNTNVRIDSGHSLQSSNTELMTEKLESTNGISQNPLDRLNAAIDSMLADTSQSATLPGSIVDVLA